MITRVHDGVITSRIASCNGGIKMAAKQLKFQEAMKRLDEIVALLNNNELELEEAMSLFEEGLKLSAQCEKQLKKFETKMDQLMEVNQDVDE